ncbi:MAG: hypothetical protein A2W61_08350 [Deltaproteobacteria bacterium RIFCSPLOWO2_01_44_7]|nr:MAG: hypothetical protein A2712_02310 [Deltaproteobacteria bacterium RIFCSPHIGHO2_01_FULL_43_49]OGQ15042.1 MAG: hypothetical protein A3D22_03170 [Deltaproteobacteria bacterium RIFCSPHIGHO2_02_FULL_44_53]OGQ27339.1 MAG: hypothetical protein A3D98_02905 [Deltaproteobacteria bacterium RIFCSPHIGHO2_12_FULL_44_21]OGQ31559.1 MAG: hypothetical protein A2979_04330 [Deltaproteobacteria bacterium RIFCSPLOWO2_01_FULL_45_74]OGQ42630.1 MAG: hypothetical protein A2W61_08350 [Deltaproteobacteria bacterium 
MKVLVTGACGFIGYELVRALEKLGYDVTAFVHRESKRPSSYFKGPVIVGDIRNLSDLERVGRVDCIHHFAAHSDPVDFGIDMMETNVIGTSNILEIARKNRSKVIFISSSAIYGNLPGPYREDGETQPLNAYASTKATAEYFCRAYVQEHHLDCIILRYFNTYGEGEEIKEKDASMVSHFIQSILNTDSVEIYGDGKQQRDFIYVKDAIQANILAMNARGLSGKVFNVGTGKTTSYNELVGIIRKKLKREIAVRHVDNPIKAFYQLNTQADLSQTAAKLNFKTHYSLEQGIEEVIKHYNR